MKMHKATQNVEIEVVQGGFKGHRQYAAHGLLCGLASQQLRNAMQLMLDCPRGVLEFEASP